MVGVVQAGSRFILALAMSLTLLYGAAGTAHAACPPSAPRSLHDSVARYVAMIASASGMTGLRATILQTNPVYTGIDDAGTNTTIMMTESTHHNWAQLGWFKSKIDGGTVKRETGLEFWLNQGATNVFHFWPARPVGEGTSYQILKVTSGFEWYQNGALLITMGPAFTPSEYQIFGETHDYADQMPGGTSVHETVRSASDYSSGAWHTVLASMGTGWTFYGYSNPGTGNGDIWDKACTS